VTCGFREVLQNLEEEEKSSDFFDILRFFRSDDFRPDEVLKDVLCCISDEIRHSPVNPCWSNDSRIKNKRKAP
jgi:hypothetical protein